jgi:hypothetical protein
VTEIQQQFSGELHPTVWKILPVFEVLIDRWQEMSHKGDYSNLQSALQKGIDSLTKYYNKANISAAQVVSLYLNPCTKDEYFRQCWTSQGQEAVKMHMSLIVSSITTVPNLP